MTKANNTKRALLASVLSMMLCVAMLVGSTFAWFVDSVTSGKNKIVSGNLDVKLEYSYDGVAWAEVKEDTNMFKEGALWEPGYTEVVYLKVKNAGSLALKYQIGINDAAGKVIGKTADDKDIDLANFIEFGVVEAKAAFADRATAREAVKDTAGLISAGYSSAVGHLTAGSDSDMLALVVYMPEDTGNEANHGTGKTQPTIYIGINLVATQDAVEKDGFDEKYDDAAELEKTAEYTINGVSVRLTEKSYDSIKNHDKAGYTDKIYSIELWSKTDLVSAVELINKSVICHNTTNDIHPKLIFKADIDFGGDIFEGLISNIDVEGNGHTLSNVKFVGDSDLGKAGFIPYAGNNRVNGLTIKDAAAIGAQAGIFAGNASNVQLTDCALAGSITVTYAAAAKETYNGVGAVFGVTAEGTSTVGVDITNADITINREGITYENGKTAETDTNLVGVVYGGSYIIQ